MIKYSCEEINETTLCLRFAFSDDINPDMSYNKYGSANMYCENQRSRHGTLPTRHSRLCMRI